MKANWFLIFIVILMGMMGAAVVWVEAKAGWEMAMGLGIVGFITMIVFGQQILSQNIVSSILSNLVSYDKEQAGVEKERAKIQVEYAKAMRETAKAENKITEQQYRQLQVAAQRMAGYLSAAEVEKVKAEMMGYGVGSGAKQLTNSEFDLDD